MPSAVIGGSPLKLFWPGGYDVLNVARVWSLMRENTVLQDVHARVRGGAFADLPNPYSHQSRTLTWGQGDCIGFWGRRRASAHVGALDFRPCGQDNRLRSQS